jgi:hypothetical protein
MMVAGDRGAVSTVSRRRWLRSATGFAVTALLSTLPPRSTPAGSIETDREAFRALLDAKTFVVAYGPAGKPSLGEDVLTFADGLFASRGCERYGFEAAPYWLRMDGDTVHFRAEMHSPEAGIIAFTGHVAGDTLDATSVWTRERWYRTVRLDSWYQGKLAAPGQPLPQKS